jgi:predicted phosphodiesterase|tara:strand:+ start:2235 stop:3608 length:1374 start_codon:yes stop_codon:yes gene_type:complete
MEAHEILSKHDINDHPSRIAFARFLAKHYPQKTVKGWEMYLIKTQNQNQSDAGTYYYDEELDHYTTQLISGQISMSGDEHREMILDYAAPISMPIASICTKYNIPRSHFDQYRRIHKFTRNTIPMTNEQIMEDEEDWVLNELVEARRHTMTGKLAKKEHAQLVKDATNWRELEINFLNHLPELKKAATKVPKLKFPEATNPYALVVCPTDFHWGKGGWVDEVGESYNFEEAKHRLFTKTQELISRIPSTPEKIYVGAGSDWFHVDNDAGTTTKGTPQDMCGSPAEILITGCKLAREHIDLLRQIAPIEIVMMAGNHDRHSSLALMMYLSAAYEDCDDVNIMITPNNRRYITYGNNLLGFTHGDGLNKKISMGSLMAVEARREWGACEHKIWFHGHLHHQRLHEKDGVLIMQMPSLAGHDRYHARSGYTMAKAGLAAYFIDTEQGYIGSLFAPITESD